MAERIEAIAIDGLGEIVPGDDLPSLIADAVAAASDVLPLRDDDVLVVTQKIVSKAEGAVVDLTTIEPRPSRPGIRAAATTATRARSRSCCARPSGSSGWRNGVIITETHHGFVCANGGIDASNVGPASGSIVTLLPTDPDASADGIRAALRERLGQDVPVVVSDSFGRPWRLGIVDVALGVSGLLPLDDLRGTPDADGRVMRSTVRAVADEMASAAELVLGKTAAAPARARSRRTFVRGEGRIADVLMPAEMDLFR